MRVTARHILFPLFLHSAHAWQWPNSTVSSNTSTAVPVPTPKPYCQLFYPTDIRIMHSRYPDYDISPIHERENMVMLLRQRDDTFQVASQVQFNGLSTIQNQTCHLHLQLPVPSLSKIEGPQPIFNVYQVAREPGKPTTWNMFDAKNLTEREPFVFGQVNGTAAARDEVWAEHGGLIDIGPTKCNETLTFQMNMAFNGDDAVNYWQWITLPPPAYPAQGFSIKSDC